MNALVGACMALTMVSQVALAVTCTVKIPNDPLTAKGLSSLFILSGCSQAKDGEQTFVEGAIYDPFTNTVSVYNPLIVDINTLPAANPVVPILPDGAIVALWFGTNADALVLTGDVKGGSCINGLLVGTTLSAFGQFAYCNAPAFFASAAAVQLPDLGTASDGQPCLTTRDFGLVDADQSDNVITKYLLSKDNKVAQNNLANKKALVGATLLENGSDNLLLTVLDDIMGCKPFVAKDLAELSAESFIPSLALNELHANKLQAQPVAVIPDNDPMALDDNGKFNIAKLNLYRLGVNQPIGASSAALDYCKSYSAIAPARFLLNKDILLKAPSIDTATGDSMFTFLAARFVNSFGPDGLNCTGFGLVSPVSVTLDANGVATDAVIGPDTNGGVGVAANNNNNDLILGGAVGGGSAALLLLGGAFFVVRRRSRRSLANNKMEATNPGYTGPPTNNGGFGAAFSNFRQSFMPQSFSPQSFMPSAQWGQNIRQSVMNFGGFRSSRTDPSASSPPGPAWGGNNQQMKSSAMSSNPSQSMYMPPQQQQQPQYGMAPSGGQYGGGPSRGGYGGAPPPNQYGAPPSPYGGQQSQYGAPPSQYGGAPPSQYGGAPPPFAPPPRYGGGGGYGGPQYQ